MKYGLANILRAVNGLRLRHGIGRRYAGRLSEFLTAAPPPAGSTTMATWVRDYLCAPAEQLGRRGAVCPFMPKALSAHRFHTIFQPGIDGRRPTLVKDVVLSHAEDFLALFPLREPDDAYNALLIVFPDVPEDRGGLMDDVHLEFKTHLMAKGLMLAPMHPRSIRGGYRNPAFPVFRAPLVCMAVRYMSEHDVVWVGHNRRAFGAYRARFGRLAEHGELAAPFLAAYRDALSRFG